MEEIILIELGPMWSASGLSQVQRRACGVGGNRILKPWSPKDLAQILWPKNYFTFSNETWPSAVNENGLVLLCRGSKHEQK